MSDSEENVEEELIYFRERPEWKDIKPIPQDDGPNPVVQIAYTERFRDVYDYLRAVMNKNEKSERALELTSEAIDCNPANYTVWHYRREILQELKLDLTKELEFIEEIVLSEPKNYQVWFHRQKLIEWTNDPSKELDLTAKVFEEDGKNYHAWQHRQWVIKTYNLWEGELEFVSELLQKDLRNNSAWNQRYFVISNTTGLTDEVVHREVDYTLGFIKKTPNNESPWNYLLGILKGRSLSEQASVRSVCDYLRSQHVPSPFLLSTLIDIYEEEAAKGNQDSLAKALELCEELSTKIDRIREQYWNYVAKKLKLNYATITGESSADDGNTADPPS